MEYLMLIFLSGLIFLLILVLPKASTEYNLDRLFMQLSIFIAIIVIIGGIIFLTKFINYKKTLIILTIIFMVFFLFSYSAFWQFSKSHEVIWLNNFGRSFDVLYPFEGELLATSWINNFKESNLKIYLDRPGKARFRAFIGSNKDVEVDLLPSIITRDSYVYFTHSNNLENIAFLHYNGNSISYNSPKDFLIYNKNKIYDNGESIIFR